MSTEINTKCQCRITKGKNGICNESTDDGKWGCKDHDYINKYKLLSEIKKFKKCDGCGLYNKIVRRSLCIDFYKQCRGLSWRFKQCEANCEMNTISCSEHSHINNYSEEQLKKENMRRCQNTGGCGKVAYFNPEDGLCINCMEKLNQKSKCKVIKNDGEICGRPTNGTNGCDIYQHNYINDFTNEMLEEMLRV